MEVRKGTYVDVSKKQSEAYFKWFTYVRFSAGCSGVYQLTLITFWYSSSEFIAIGI